MYWGKDMEDIYISGTGIWTPPHKVSNQELRKSPESAEIAPLRNRTGQAQ